MQNIDLADLLKKYKAGTISEAEMELLENWYLQWQPEDQQLTLDELIAVKDEIWQAVQPRRKTRKLWPRIAAAASILICCSIGLYLYQHQKSKTASTQVARQDILPGKNQATLTLSNGQKIILTASLNGKLAQQGNTIIQASAQAITYNAAPGENETLAYNTLTTVRGQESPVPLVLSDGTKVWLNAASSITYPVAFNGNDRTVKITGEAYFEVVHNAAKPFKVEVKGQTIEDIGTAFNVNAYDDEPVIKTTLISGSVKLQKLGASVVLQPGQAGIVLADGKGIKVVDADIEQAIAWKEGYFQIDHADLKTIMRQVSRWYDVDVEYEGKIPDEPFTGRMKRSVNASKFMDMLTFFNIHYKIEDHKIIVSP